MDLDAYRGLAGKLDALPNGFPATDDGRELDLLAKLFTPEDAQLAALLTPAFETVEELAARTGRDFAGLRDQLKGLSKRGLIEVGKKDGALGFKLLPFVVGIYENQVGTLDAELARLFEEYFKSAFAKMLSIKPQFHRVIPVNETVRNSLEVRPFESASEIVNAMQAWGVQDCICRKQKALIGQGCDHPLDVCMVMAPRANVFDKHPFIRPLTHAEAMQTLRRAAEAGLVHSVSNTMEGMYYICNCCSCSCGMLRGMAELGIANVMVSSAFVNRVDEAICNGCEDCIPTCQFKALSMTDLLAQVDPVRCTGCGVCVLACSTGALGLIRRPDEEVLHIPRSHAEWESLRFAERGL